MSDQNLNSGAFDELIARLGNIPPSRIVLQPAPGTATESDVLAAASSDRKRLCELVDGVLIDKATEFREAVLMGYLASELGGVIRPRNLGVVAMGALPLRIFPGRIRFPDIAYFRWDCFPGRRLPDEEIASFMPTLIVEGISPRNTPEEMTLKRRDYFGSGVRMVWEIDVDGRTARCYRASNECTKLNESDSLDGGDVLPGFQFGLRKLFAELDRHG